MKEYSKINDLDKYLDSSNFKNLCEALDFLSQDIDEIKRKARNLDDKSGIEESLALIIYNQLLKYDETSNSKEFHEGVKYSRWLSEDTTWSFAREELFYQVFIRDNNKWEDIKNKLKAGIYSGKISSDYLFEKEYNHELELLSTSEVKNALNIIYLHEIHYLLNSHNINKDIKKALFKDACLNGGFYENPLLFDEVKEYFKKTLELVLSEPLIDVKEFGRDSLWVSYLIIQDKELAPQIDKYISKIDQNYIYDWSNNLFTYPSYMGGEIVFYLITCGDFEGYKHRDDFSNIYIIKKELIENSWSLLVHQNSELANHFEDYVDDSFKSSYNLDLKEEDSVEYDNFKVTKFINPEDGKIWHIFDVLNKTEESDYNHEDLFEIASQKPLSEEFIQLISSLNFDIEYAYEIQNTAEDSDEVLFMINKKILQDKNYSQDILSKEELLSEVDKLYFKTILNSKDEQWDEIKEDLISKINSKEVKSSYDLQFAFGNMLKANFFTNILNAQIEALLEFKELDLDYAKQLTDYFKDLNEMFEFYNPKHSDSKKLASYLNCITDWGYYLPQYLNDLIKVNTEIKQKEYPDEGKFAAPRWLVYPELDAYTMGWRMGYGETYAMNEPWHTDDFYELFPKPQNWLFDRRKSDLETFPALGYFWRDNGEQKYSKIISNPIEVNEFITIEQRDEEFQYNSKIFKSIEHAILTAKYDLFNKIDYYNTTLNTLKRGFDLTDDEISYWQNFKYSVLLNAAYYKFMQDENLKERLLKTGNKSLIYNSDDEWGGYENLFGFALMELRDEIRRLYENEDLIDWEYTEYLKEKDPYEKPKERNPEDEQSPEYRIISSILSECELYVRDVNLKENLAEKYEIGQILTEKAFVDASDNIGGMITTHRYSILSNQMADLSGFENGTNWGLHTTKAGSKFKILDIYKVEDKTQILLLQLPEGFEEVFENKNKLIDEVIEDSREEFEDLINEEPIKDLTTDEWLERVSFPIGMNDAGNFY
ncbi:NADAR domain-containing protein [Methanobrevibacter sp.]|uniref:NADAR domain-containing protein n=1 Tax=Methanobrevibacter sp. TaxID=66852 RepID=UPI00388F2965